MRALSILAGAIALGLTSGCTGDLAVVDGDNDGNGTTSDGGAGGSGDARALYEQTVDPIMQTCGTASACHGITGPQSPQFVYAGDAAQTYDAIVSYRALMVGDFDKTSARMLTYLHPDTGGHTVSRHTAAQVETIGAWLDAEKTARAGSTGDDGSGAGAIARQLQEEWSGCMDLAQWQQLQVAELWAQYGSTKGICGACHDTGGEGAIYSEESQFVFDLVTTNEHWMLSYFSPQLVDPDDPDAEPRMVIARPRLQAVGTASTGHENHGLFDLAADEPAVIALEAFYEDTMNRKLQGACGPPRL